MRARHFGYSASSWGRLDGARRRSIVIACAVLAMASAGRGAELAMTLDEAMAAALEKTARGRIIRGQAEVAVQQYQAKSINFKVPEVSINGSVPAFDVDESYRFFGGANTKQLYSTRDVSFNSFIELKQSLITGGVLTGTANLNADDSRYPDTRVIGGENFVNEALRRGFFDFRLDQPLFRPSDGKKLLHDLQDDRDIAEATQRQREGALRREVTTAYMGVLRFLVKQELANDRLQMARAQVRVDSLKLQDGIISEEIWLQSEAKSLDAELAREDAEVDAREQERQLSALLDLESSDTVQPSEPQPPPHFEDATEQRLVAEWERTVAVRQADRGYRKAQRQANFAAASHRISGDLQAHYAFGRGNVETTFFNEEIDDDIDTQGWGLLLRVRIPVWDGGAGRAAVKAARFQSEQARLEYEQQVKNARAEIVNQLNDLDVSYRRLDIIRRQIELAANRQSIAESRFKDGQISEIKFLESRIFHREQRDRYLEELDRYLGLRIELEHRFLPL